MSLCCATPVCGGCRDADIHFVMKATRTFVEPYLTNLCCATPVTYDRLDARAHTIQQPAKSSRFSPVKKAKGKSFKPKKVVVENGQMKVRTVLHV